MEDIYMITEDDFKRWYKLFDKIPNPLAVQNVDIKLWIEKIDQAKMAVASNISDLFINRGKSKWINVMYDCNMWGAKDYKQFEIAVKSNKMLPTVCVYYDINQIPKKYRGLFTTFDEFDKKSYDTPKYPPLTSLGIIKARARGTKFAEEVNIEG
jgi:hypothetical protein